MMNNKILSPIIMIEYNSDYQFILLEDKNNINHHPAINYYLKLDDLSVNLLISLRWIKWAYFFLNSISLNLSTLGNEYSIEYIISKNIENLCKNEEKSHILEIDGVIIQNNIQFEIIIREVYKLKVFSPNTKVHLKLKINLREYLIISNMLFPTLIKFNEN